MPLLALPSTLRRACPLLGALLVACSGAAESGAGADAAIAVDALDGDSGLSSGLGDDGSAGDAGAAGDGASGVDASDQPALALINEVYKNQPGVDVHEFIELVGAANTDLSSLSLVLLESDPTENLGTIDEFFVGGTTDGSGYWTTGFLSQTLSNGALTILLVTGFDAREGDDLDTDDDGVLDIVPWLTVVDELALVDDADDVPYSAVVVASGFGAVPEEYDGVARIPDGSEVSDWIPHDEGGSGLEGVAGFGGALCPDCGVSAPESGAAIVTPRAANRIAQ